MVNTFFDDLYSLPGDSPEVRRRSFATLRMTARNRVILSVAKDLWCMRSYSKRVVDVRE